MNIRMDVDLWRRLEEHAPLQRRSVAGLLHKLVADGLDRLDDELAMREVQRDQARLLSGLKPREIQMILKRQRALLARARGERAPVPPLPPSLRGPRR
jgi:hypothetical protein